MNRVTYRTSPLQPQVQWRITLLWLGSILFSRPCTAIPAAFGEPVPVDRLLTNVSRYMAQNPDDPQGHYTLGRLHSLAFTGRLSEVKVRLADPETNQPLRLPEFAPYDPILQKRREEVKEGDTAAYHHLAESVRHYRRAAELAPKVAISWLGLGWMLEQGAPFAAKVDAPFLEKPKRASADDWRGQALAAYRRAFALNLDEDLKREYLADLDSFVTLEAGEGMLRVMEQRSPTAAEQAEATRVRGALKVLQSKPLLVSPIIFPLRGTTSLEALIDPQLAVSFDLDGNGEPELWPWVGPNTGILVWDPEGTGRIVSGRQLFGSVTWWMFWKDGYQPLAALDDNGDGWLSGPELEGLAVWCDQNSNAISEAGEVRLLPQIGILRVAVRASGRSSGALFNRRGVQRQDGAYLPTYDWKPMSLPRIGHTGEGKVRRVGSHASPNDR
jgi:hypothetical protein